MESEKAWAVWSPFDGQGILYGTILGSKELAESAFGMTRLDRKRGYVAVPITINYEKPQASDEEE